MAAPAATLAHHVTAINKAIDPRSATVGLIKLERYAEPPTVAKDLSLRRSRSYASAAPLRLTGGEQADAGGDDDESGELEATQMFAKEQERPERCERREL